MMIVLKIILCSSLLLTVYYVFLQKEKMYGFNRFYLLFSLVFSYTVPFISIQSEAQKPVNRLQKTIEATQQVMDITPKQESFNWMNLIWILYGIVTLIFLTRTIISYLKIKNLKGEKMIYENQNIIITNEPISPFSFWNTICLGKNYLIDNKIDSRIFLHEKSHLEQKHSIDIIIVEIIKAFTWFNPSVYFYKKAIITNHEFLADESVLKNDFTIKDYQNLILEEIISNQNYNLTHTFNFKNTKKRFIMMNTKKSKLADLKKVISIPVLLIAFGLFVQKTYATPMEKMIETTQETISEPVKKQIAESNEPITDVLKNESLNPESGITEQLSENMINGGVVQDTIRPKEGKNMATKDETTLLPQYPGGINEMRNKMAKAFDASKMNLGKETYRTEINYTVLEDGNIADVKASGNNEAFNAEAVISFKKANENIVWKPAEKDGKPVRYSMRIPLMMSFQN
ncbi:M56 family metallopeptidase [Chryseobacterium gambrini]|uniref:M56 family metallopeptidase n=1 Tax=Chryseobacterium gambrini TaxID=373672 RepID=UPI0022F40053|nr:M56 family metallopeptidase [Chryseobacterium gambrini]WBX99759.1 M56 family metallopeptidase [Chryseobacterium gambrini]